jgi:MoxR-like ATPase
MARSFAAVTGLRFTRVQFTPDLMPSDVTGSAIYDQRTGALRFQPGADLHERPARRRDQPRAAEDAGGAAGSHAGAPGHERTPDDVKLVAVPALAHRITLRPELWIQRVESADVVRECLDRCPASAARVP